MWPQLIGLHGPMRVGKTTVANTMVSCDPNTVLVAIAGPLKILIGSSLGINDTDFILSDDFKTVLTDDLTLVPPSTQIMITLGISKAEQETLIHIFTMLQQKVPPTVGKALQVVGTHVRELIGKEFWNDLARPRILKFLQEGKKVVVTDTRYQNEADMVRSLGGLVVKIEGLQRFDVLDGRDLNHTSEQPIKCDIVFVNDSQSLEELRRQVKVFLS